MQDSAVDPWGSLEPFGSFWFWLGGKVVGNTDVAEQLVDAFTPFYTHGASGNRRASDVPGISGLDKFDFIVWRRFGEDEEFEPQRWGNADIAQLRQLDLMRSTFELQVSVFGITIRRRSIATYEMRNLRFVPGYSRRRGGRESHIAYEDGSGTISFGDGLSVAEGVAIIEQTLVVYPFPKKDRAL